MVNDPIAHRGLKTVHHLTFVRVVHRMIQGTDLVNTCFMGILWWELPSPSKTISSFFGLH